MTYAEAVETLNRSGAVWCPAWEYKGSGDFDVYVVPRYFERTVRYLVARGWKPFNCVYNHKHTFLTKNGFKVDLFSVLCFSVNGEPRQYKVKWGDFELVFSLLRYYSGRHEPQIIARIEKYLERVEVNGES